MADPTNQGQAVADSQGTTATAPEVKSGQSESVQTTQQGSGEAETFFDPKSIEHSPELMQAYRQMQGAFTKKSQAFSANKAKIDAYDAFQRDPAGTIKQLARQYGLNVLPQQEETKDWQPNTWDDVMDRARKEAKNEILKDLEPMFGKIQDLSAKSMENYLDQNFSDWRNYEDKMTELVTEHPTLANNPELLYRMAVPPSVIESRATKKALEKLKGQSEGSTVSSGTQTTQTTSKTIEKPTFQQAVDLARQELASKGIRLQ